MTDQAQPTLDDSIEFGQAFRHFIGSLKVNVRDKVKEDLGFAFTDFPILFMINNGLVYPTQISDAMRMSTSMISHMIDRTLKAKLIERQIDTEDSRKIRLSLTAEGERVLLLVNDVYLQFILASGVNQSDLQHATTVLKQLAPSCHSPLEK